MNVRTICLAIVLFSVLAFASAQSAEIPVIVSPPAAVGVDYSNRVPLSVMAYRPLLFKAVLPPAPVSPNDTQRP